MSITGSVVAWSNVTPNPTQWFEVSECLLQPVPEYVTRSPVPDWYDIVQGLDDQLQFTDHMATEAEREWLFERREASAQLLLGDASRWFTARSQTAVSCMISGVTARYLDDWARLGYSVTGGSEMSNLSITVGPNLATINRGAESGHEDEWHKCNFLLSLWGYGTPPDSDVARRAILAMPTVTKLQRDLERILGHVGVGVCWSV